MSEPARKLSEEGAVRDARRPFSSFFKRLFGGESSVPDSRTVDPSKNHPSPEEQPGEFWNPSEGSPSSATVRPMRPQVPLWKKDIPGLTDPFLDEEDNSWSQSPDRRSQQSQKSGFSAFPKEDTAAMETRDAHASPLRKLEPVTTMEPRPESQENLDVVVDRLLRDKDFLLAEELKHKAEELNQLLVQAQRQKMKVELTVSQLESRPGSSMSWLDVKIFKEI